MSLLDEMVAKAPIHVAAIKNAAGTPLYRAIWTVKVGEQNAIGYGSTVVAAVLAAHRQALSEGWITQ